MHRPGETTRFSLPVLAEEPANWGAEVLITFARAHARFERRMAEAVGAHGLTLAQFDVLATLSRGEDITQQELAERLLVTKGNVVGLIDRLCKAGWVERRADPSDRRANRLYLTEPGRKRLAEAHPCVIGFGMKLLGAFSKDELRQMHSLLSRLEAATGE